MTVPECGSLEPCPGPVCIARGLWARLRDIATTLGITKRSVFGLVLTRGVANEDCVSLAAGHRTHGMPINPISTTVR